MTESSERSLRAEQRGKRLRFTRRRRLRRGVKPRFEATSTGQPERRAEKQLRCTESTACRRPRAAEHRPRPRGHPNCSRGLLRFGGAIERGHGQPGQRERRQGAGPGNRVRVQLRERRSVRRQTGSKWHRRRVKPVVGAIGIGAGQPESVPNMGIARRAFGHDGRCVGRAKANARRSTSGGSSHLREAPGGCAGASRPHRPGRLIFRVASCA